MFSNIDLNNCYGESCSCCSNNYGRRPNDILCRWFCCSDLFIGNGKYLVERSNNAIYYSYSKWKLYRNGFEWLLFGDINGDNCYR